ncbi:hypothetical protein [Burkholderia sp. MSMB1072]|uniref:hypothetical protein n=1 Tax=Burkholderia sp. MSMB1072 TaxID=1637871 RepID=UPI000B1724EF|nr:hypothetical protein [Burkholderia sp. MSMB1072]
MNFSKQGNVLLRPNGGVENHARRDARKCHLSDTPVEGEKMPRIGAGEMFVWDMS